MFLLHWRAKGGGERKREERSAEEKTGVDRGEESQMEKRRLTFALYSPRVKGETARRGLSGDGSGAARAEVWRWR